MDIRIPLASSEAIEGSGTLPCDDKVQVSFYENEVPAFAGPEIDRLYGHLYCSLAYFEMAKELAGASTYVAIKNGSPIAILLYKKMGGNVTVINEYVSLNEAEIQRFANHLFGRFESVNVISFRKVHSTFEAISYPYHAAACSEDMVVTLPRTVKEYEAAVGKNMRRNIKRYTNALIRSFPSYHYRLYLDAEVNEQHVRDIVALSCKRMQSKHIQPRFTEEEIQWITNFAKKCGIVGIAIIDGKVCAGAIGFRIGENYFMHVIAHDLKYNGYSLGILCYYHTICEGISRGAKRFHLLQGRYEYKYRLLAEKWDFFHLDIYRNRLSLLADAPRAFKKELKGRIWLTKQWLLQDVERRDGRVFRLIGGAVKAIRTLKRSNSLFRWGPRNGISEL